MPSMAARGYWKLGAIGCRGASWSEQLDDKEFRGALESAIGTERIPVFWTSSAHPFLPATVWYSDFKGLCKSCCTTVMQKRNTPYSSVFLSRSVRSCIRLSVRSLLYSRSGCFLFSKRCLQELVHLWQVFVRGGSPFAASVWLWVIISPTIARSLEYPKVWHELLYRCLPGCFYLVVFRFCLLFLLQSSILKYCILVTILSSKQSTLSTEFAQTTFVCSVQVIPSFHTSLSMVHSSIQDFRFCEA